MLFLLRQKRCNRMSCYVPLEVLISAQHDEEEARTGKVYSADVAHSCFLDAFHRIYARILLASVFN
jgi:hypothetical protein